MRVAELRGAKHRSLLAVRIVRERSEELEERALGEVVRELQRVKVTVEQLQAEMVARCDEAARGVNVLTSGQEIRQCAAEMDALKRRGVEAQAELQQLEARRHEQMQRYLSAHVSRRAIEELQEKRRLADLTAIAKRERKAGEELFLGRRVLLQQRVEQEVGSR